MTVSYDRINAISLFVTVLKQVLRRLSDLISTAAAGMNNVLHGTDDRDPVLPSKQLFDSSDYTGGLTGIKVAKSSTCHEFAVFQRNIKLQITGAI